MQQQQIAVLVSDLNRRLDKGDEHEHCSQELLPLLKAHYERVHAQVERLKPLLDQRAHLHAEQVRNARRTQLYNLNTLLDTKLATYTYDLDTLSTLKVHYIVDVLGGFGTDGRTGRG